MRKALLLSIVAIMCAVAFPARAQFCPGVSPWVFDDVAASDPFCGYITWMAENGITLGCQTIDANHRLYCPNTNVTRAAMAVFMNRLANIRVEAVDTGPGLTGGPITSVGTINLATTQLLPTTACATNQIARWNGSAWVCSNDASSGGTVTSVASGTGLAGGPITTSGALSIAAGYRLPQGCSSGQVAKSDGAGLWTCASDVQGSGTVASITAGAGLTGGTITTSGTIAVDPASALFTGNFLRQGGNATGATVVFGTTDSQALEAVVQGRRVMRYQSTPWSPNIIGGSVANTVKPGVVGAVIAGGGESDTFRHAVFGSYSTIGGGYGNVVGSEGEGATVAGGAQNAATNVFSTVAGGSGNFATGPGASVGGGEFNLAYGEWSSIGGGYTNMAPGYMSTVSGGESNYAGMGWTSVMGGLYNRASGAYSSVIGGRDNQAIGAASLAGGTSAIANADGCFVWGDASTSDPVFCDVTNRFVVRSLGGVLFLVGSSAPGAYSGVWLPPGGSSWVATSDRNLKENVEPVSPLDVLERLASMPIATWNLKAQGSGIRHMGPMAQDFRAAFGLGESEVGINTIDADGVALAAIQGLNAKLEAKLRERDAQIAELKRLVEVLLARTSPEGRVASR